MKSKHVGRDRSSDSKFAELLETSLKKEGELRAGTHVLATVSSTKNKDFIFISSSLGSGIIPREELQNEEGEITVNAGEKIHVFFRAAAHGEKVYTTIPSGRETKEILETARNERIPLTGRILRKNKGGYEVQIGDATAFCPGSQMEGESDNPGTRLPFLITEVSDRKVVVSHRSFRDLEREKQKLLLRGELQEGDIISGNVLSLHEFGAFVDLGGVEGLIPVSELSFKRVNHPSEVLTVGQSVRARVLSVDWKEDRITLSYRALLENPWQGSLPFNEGDTIEGVVESLKHFGIFVRLPDNFTGLIPLSETGLPRGQSPDKTFQAGEKIRVMILRIDRDNERISLSVRRVHDADARKEYEDYMKEADQKAAPEDGISSFGRALLDSLSKEKGKGK